MRELRKKTIRFRVSESEYEAILAQIPPGIAMSALFRERLTGGSLESTFDHRMLANQIARIGNNLNQIARGVNTANAAGTRFDLIRVFQTLRQISEQIKELHK